MSLAWAKNLAFGITAALPLPFPLEIIFSYSRLYFL